MNLRPRLGILTKLIALALCAKVSGSIAAEAVPPKTKVVVTIPDQKPKPAPKPTALAIVPGDIALKGHRSTSQLIANGDLPGNKRADFTRDVTWSSANDKVAQVLNTGRLIQLKLIIMSHFWSLFRTAILSDRLYGSVMSICSIT